MSRSTILRFIKVKLVLTKKHYETRNEYKQPNKTFTNANIPNTDNLLLEIMDGFVQFD